MNLIHVEDIYGVARNIHRYTRHGLWYVGKYWEGEERSIDTVESRLADAEG